MLVPVREHRSVDQGRRDLDRAANGLDSIDEDPTVRRADLVVELLQVVAADQPVDIVAIGEIEGVDEEVGAPEPRAANRLTQIV